MNWLFKLQDILTQIIAVKYRPGANNTAADYISRHFPPLASINSNPSATNETHEHRPIGYQQWSDELPKPQRTQFIQSFVSQNISTPNVEINTVTTRAQSKLRAQPRSSSDYASPASPKPQSSCSPSSTADQLYDFSLPRIRSEQVHDAIIQRIIQQIRNNRHYHSFILQDGILYKLAFRGNATIKLVYAPSKLVPELMAAYHDHPLSGHFDIRRTWTMLKNIYYWSRMKNSIISYMKSCDKCSQFNVDRHKPPGFLQSIQPPNDVFQVLGMDSWGPTTTSLSGNLYVLVITNQLSGYVFAKASPTNTAQDTARILMEEIILGHGSPDIIISDQGPHFKNELMQAISHLVGCKHIFSTPYHPRINGQTERWNSTFVTQIAKYCNTDQNNWDTFLPSIVYAYNNGIHRSTGFTPYTLAFGRRPRHPFHSPASTFVFNKPHDYWTQVIQYRHNFKTSKTKYYTSTRTIKNSF